MSVLIVDDSRTNLVVLTAMVSKLGVTDILTSAEPRVALLQLSSSSPSLIIVDYMMPEMDGIEFIRQVRSITRFQRTPIVMVTTADLRDVRLAALEAGATDFINKPIEPTEFKARIRNLLELGEAQSKLQETAIWLAREVKSATNALATREEEIIFRLTRAAEFRDNDTGEHVSRIAIYSRLIAQALVKDEDFCHNVYLAAPMHDVGKIGVPDAILLKNGPLTDEERTAMQEHVRYGSDILASSTSPLIRLAAEIARTHHERWDGTGYPHRLEGDGIPLSGRIVAVADVFDALTSTRPYKEAWSTVRAREYLIDQSGKHFDPACVEAFLSQWPAIIAAMDAMKANRSVLAA